MIRAGAVTAGNNKPAGSEQLASIVPDNIYGNGAFTGGVHRGGVVGVADSLFVGSSNLGLAASIDSSGWALGALHGVLSGGKQYKMRHLLNVVQPTVLDAWALALWRVDVCLSWVASAAATDSGLVLSLNGGATVFPNQIIGGAAEGIIVYNDAGVLKYFSRGNASTETVVISPAFYAANLLTDWTRVRFDVRNARKTAPASVRLYVNENLVLERKWTGAHALPVPAAVATSYMAAHLIHRVSSAVNWMRYLQSTLAIGPDSDGV